MIATCEFSGSGAPMFEAARPADSLILPDHLTTTGKREGADRMRWWEVKWKAKADLTRSTNRLETGVDRVNYDHYTKVQNATGIPCWMIFLHERQNEVLAQSLEKLDAAKRYTPMFGKGGMMMFPCSAFIRVCDYDAMVGPSPPWNPGAIVREHSVARVEPDPFHVEHVRWMFEKNGEEFMRGVLARCDANQCHKLGTAIRDEFTARAVRVLHEDSNARRRQ